MKDKTYKAIKASEKPKREDAYFVDCGINGITSAFWNEDMNKWQMLPDGYIVEYWLEEVEQDQGDNETILLDSINRGLRRWNFKDKLSFDDAYDLLFALQEEIVGKLDEHPTEQPDEEPDQLKVNTSDTYKADGTEQISFTEQPTEENEFGPVDLTDVEPDSLDFRKQPTREFNKMTLVIFEIALVEFAKFVWGYKDDNDILTGYNKDGVIDTITFSKHGRNQSDFKFSKKTIDMLSKLTEQPTEQDWDDVLGTEEYLNESGDIEQPSNTRELSDDEIYKCMLKGGKDKCSYKSKDAMACVMLRKCEYVKLIESTEQPTRGLSDEDHYIAYDMKFESGIKHTLIPPKPNKCPICGGLECGEGFCNNPFDKDGNPL